MAEKVLELQKQLKHNSDDLQDFLKDLNRWEIQAKKKDEELKKEKAIYKKDIPPIRNAPTKKNKKSKKKTKVQEEPKNGTKKKARISSYDYDSWSKFNVEEACEEVDKNDTENESSEDEEEDLEEREAKENEHRKLRANLEKDKGNNLFKEGKMEAAIEHYTKGIFLDPENAILPANRAMALLKLGRYAAAEGDCSASLVLDPTYVKAYARRAVARQHQKNLEGALSDYTEILKLEPKHKQAAAEKEKLSKLLKNTSVMKKEDNPVGRRRSNKPLRRVKIEEVGSDSEDGQTTAPSIPKQTLPKATVTSEIIKDVQSSQKTPSPETQSTILTQSFRVPTTSLEFDVNFRRLKEQPNELYEYTKILPPKMFPRLLAQSIEEALPKFIHVYREFYQSNDMDYLEGLLYLTKVPRFDMARMFMSSKQKEDVCSLLQAVRQKLSSKQYGHISAEKLQEIALKYKVSI